MEGDGGSEDGQALPRLEELADVDSEELLATCSRRTSTDLVAAVLSASVEQAAAAYEERHKERGDYLSVSRSESNPTLLVVEECGARGTPSPNPGTSVEALRELTRMMNSFYQSADAGDAGSASIEESVRKHMLGELGEAAKEITTLHQTNDADAVLEILVRRLGGGDQQWGAGGDGSSIRDTGHHAPLRWDLERSVLLDRVVSLENESRAIAKRLLEQQSVTAKEMASLEVENESLRSYVDRLMGQLLDARMEQQASLETTTRRSRKSAVQKSPAPRPKKGHSRTMSSEH